MEERDIEHKAMGVLQKCDDKGDSYVNIIGIANKLGFVVGNVKLNDDDDGFIIVDDKDHNLFNTGSNMVIGVKEEQTDEWKRFIIAHEIGHYILHYNKEIDGGIYAHRDHKKGKGQIENEADFFAANILMPRDRFSKQNSILSDAGLSFEERIVILAKRFGVTQIMTVRRFGELGING